MKYIRAGKEITISVTGLFGLPTLDVLNEPEFWNNVKLDLSGGDTLKIYGVNPVISGGAPPNFIVNGFDIVIKLPSDAKSGLRDLLIGNGENNAQPLILKDFITVLPAGYKGAQLWFFHKYASKIYTAGEIVYINRPGDYPGINIQDTYDDDLPINKTLVYDTYLSQNTNTPRLYMYDCIADANKIQPSVDPMITGTTPMSLSSGPDGTMNHADLHVERLVDGQETGEGDVRGYLDQNEFTKEWTKPSELLCNPTDTVHQSNLPAVWRANGAAAIAPDEFQNGEYLIQPDGALDAGRRPGTSPAGPAFSLYRGVMGFPSTNAASPNMAFYRNLPAPATLPGYYIPAKSSNRKQYFYLSTAHWFYSKEKLADQKSKIDPALWNQSTVIPGTIPVNDYYTSFMIHQLPLLGLPLYYRTHDNVSGNNDFKLAQAAQPVENKFEPFGGLLNSDIKSFWYHTNANAPESRSVLYITIDPIEVVLPGPRFADGPANECTYKRNHESFTKHSKIKVWYQDLFAFSDQDKLTGLGTDTAVPHTLSEPVCLMEAYCPRMDMNVNYLGWTQNDFEYMDQGGAGTKTVMGPAGTEELNDKRGQFPSTVFTSQPFEWTLVCDSLAKARSGLGNTGAGTGTYDVNGETALKVAEQLFAEFTGLKCKLSVHASYWPTAWTEALNGSPAGYTITPNQYNLKAGSFTFRDAAGPAYNALYEQTYEGREGTYICTSGFLEVVDDDD